MREISQREREIIRSLFPDHEASMLIERIIHGRLNGNEIESIIDVLSAEFHMEGIEKSFEANDYGKEIERIIDLVNRPRLL